MDTITDQALKSAMTAEAAFQKEVVSKLEANPKDIKKRVFQAAGGVGTTNHPFRYGEG